MNFLRSAADQFTTGSTDFGNDTVRTMLIPLAAPFVAAFLLSFVDCGGHTVHPGGALYSILFAACIIIFNAWIIPGAAWLKLDSQGFRVRYWFVENSYRWTDIMETRFT